MWLAFGATNFKPNDSTCNQPNGLKTLFFYVALLDGFCQSFQNSHMVLDKIKSI